MEEATINSKEQKPELTLPDIARSTLFDYEVKGKRIQYNAYYDFLKAYPNIFTQDWKTTPEIDECIGRLTSADYSEEDDDYVASMQSLRYNMTDAFYSVNKPLMDVICLAFRLFVQIKDLKKGA